jgi:hypothetical protein
MKSIGNIAKYTLLALWLISVALAISIGIKQAAAFTADGRVIQKKILCYCPPIRYTLNLNTMITMQKTLMIVMISK